MKYSIPKLHSLSGRKTKGNCANGSAASAVVDTCTIGGGINNLFGVYCVSGAGDADYCMTGTAAWDGGGHCSAGTMPDSTCGTGGTPLSV